MPEKTDVQFSVELAAEMLSVPASPITIPSNSAFIWPFNLDLGGAWLKFATVQPLTKLVLRDTIYFVFAEIPGVDPQFLLDVPTSSNVAVVSGHITSESDGIRVAGIKAGTGQAISLTLTNGSRRELVVLDAASAAGLWKETVFGEERLLITRSGLTVDPVDNQLQLRSDNPQDLAVSILPAPYTLLTDEYEISGDRDGLFQNYAARTVRKEKLFAHAHQIAIAGPARPIKTGSQGVAEAPEESDFEHAAVWKLQLPALPPDAQGIRLRIKYVGDVARCYVNGSLVTDNFYNGNPFEIGLPGSASVIQRSEIILKVLPLRKDAPIYLPADARPEFGSSNEVAAIYSVKVLQGLEAILSLAYSNSITESHLAEAASKPTKPMGRTR